MKFTIITLTLILSSLLKTAQAQTQDDSYKYFDASAVKAHKVKYYDKGIPLSEKEYIARLKAEEIVDPAYPEFSRLSPESYIQT